jgi:hypothetical protein
MNLNTLFAALGGGAKIVSTASSAAILLGAIYLVDCRMTARGADAIDRCYFTALPLMGVGVAGRGGFSVGYNTFNPSLHKEEKEGKEEKADNEKKEDRDRKRNRDEHGRFIEKSRA